jgi:hypothetical protein
MSITGRSERKLATVDESGRKVSPRSSPGSKPPENARARTRTAKLMNLKGVEYTAEDSVGVDPSTV